MSAQQVAEGLVRQPADVIERLSAAVEATRDQRVAAEDERNSVAGLLARALADGLTRDDVPEWVREYRAAEAALRDAREAWQAARVEWYHARGMHANANPTLCCGAA